MKTLLQWSGEPRIYKLACYDCVCFVVFHNIFFVLSFLLQQFLSVPGSHRYTHINNQVHVLFALLLIFLLCIPFPAPTTLIRTDWLSRAPVVLPLLRYHISHIFMRPIRHLTICFRVVVFWVDLPPQCVNMDTSYHQQPPQGVQSTGYTMVQAQYQQPGTIHGSHGNLANVNIRNL